MVAESLEKVALDAALSSPSRRRIGAVLVRKSKVVATAVNLETKSHPLQKRLAERVGLGPKIYLHAEINALIKAREDADTVVVARVDREGNPKLAKPCPICQLALKESGVVLVHYSTSEGFSTMLL
jgi:deoxycytidylate deaminase